MRTTGVGKKAPVPEDGSTAALVRYVGGKGVGNELDLRGTHAQRVAAAPPRRRFAVKNKMESTLDKLPFVPGSPWDQV